MQDCLQKTIGLKCMGRMFIMNTLEYTRNLFMILDISEQKAIIKKAKDRGFLIPGFSKKPCTAPVSTIVKFFGMKNKRDNLFYYDVILQIMIEKAEINDNYVYKLAKEWNSPTANREELSNELDSMVKERDIQKDDIAAGSSNSVSTSTDNDLEELKNEVTQLREKNKKNKNSIQEYKIELDNLKGKIERYEKELKNKSRELDEYENRCEKLEEEKNSLTNKCSEAELKEKELLTEIEELSYFKNNTPRIVCFSKKEKEIPVKGYNVTIVNSLNEDIRFNLKANEFDEVWFIHKGFPYGIFSEVKNLCKCKVKEFISVDSLVNKLAEGGRL